MYKVTYPLDIQMFAEGEGEGESNTSTSQPENQTTVSNSLDYEKLAEAIEKRKSRSEEGAIKGILKEQGLSGDELDEAIKTYKANKQNKVKEEQERINRIIEENNKFKQKELRTQTLTEAKAIAKDLEIRDDRIETILALCDSEKFTDEKGAVNKEAIKAELEEKLKTVPEFKASKQIIITKGRGTSVPPAATEDEAYRQRKYGKSKYFRG